MQKKKENNDVVQFAFFDYIHQFLIQDHAKVYAVFDNLTRKYLNYNNPKVNTKAYLRLPQFEALEVYAFLKEFCHNKKLWEIFEEWYYKKGVFEGRSVAGLDSQGQTTLFDATEIGSETTKEIFQKVFNDIKKNGQEYPNYIFALTMGLGKTKLMATCIFYEFLLARKYPKDEKYCHNALIFAPDRTVLQSIYKDFTSFDKSLVVPAEYRSKLDTELKIHCLIESGGSLNIIDGSDYNIIISNTQKIILKRKHAKASVVDTLFNGEGQSKYQALSLMARWASINKEAGLENEQDFVDENDIQTNQRFSKILRLKNLGIYVDEAHHVFGDKLSDDLNGTKTSSLRFTINEIAEHLHRAGTKLVACFNYTGTPYVKNRLLPEVVYSYGLSKAIENKYLKQVDVFSYSNIREDTLAFVRAVINDFWKRHEGKRYEGMLPKIAFFSPTIDDMQSVLLPAVEKVLIEKNIDTNRIIVNVGDPSLTSNDEQREFNNLDTKESEKQFILLVNKGREGWDCRSLFSVALNREPKSRIFVLQATMRCLRKITDAQLTGTVYLSSECYSILDNELQENFRMSIPQLKRSVQEDLVEVRIVPPPAKIVISRPRKMFMCQPKVLKDKVNFNTDAINMDEYKIIKKKHSIHNLDANTFVADETSLRTNRHFTAYTLTAEVARYLQMSPIKVEKILRESDDGINKLVAKVNEANDILYKYIIPKLFGELFEVTEYERAEPEEIELVKDPSENGDDHYTVTFKEGLTASLTDSAFAQFKEKSFNVDNYVFDSGSEFNLFKTLLNDKQVKKVWFTGMLTHGQSDFYINYIDPESGGVRSYYPDFITLNNDGTYTIIEVKGDNKLDDPIVIAKAYYANQVAKASGMNYIVIPSSLADVGIGIHDASQTDKNQSEVHVHIDAPINIYKIGTINGDNNDKSQHITINKE